MFKSKIFLCVFVITLFGVFYIFFRTVRINYIIYRIDVNNICRDKMTTLVIQRFKYKLIKREDKEDEEVSMRKNNECFSEQSWDFIWFQIPK